MLLLLWKNISVQRRRLKVYFLNFGVMKLFNFLFLGRDSVSRIERRPAPSRDKGAEIGNEKKCRKWGESQSKRTPLMANMIVF